MPRTQRDISHIYHQHVFLRAVLPRPQTYISTIVDTVPYGHRKRKIREAPQSSETRQSYVHRTRPGLQHEKSDVNSPRYRRHLVRGVRGVGTDSSSQTIGFLVSTKNIKEREDSPRIDRSSYHIKPAPGSTTSVPSVAACLPPRNAESHVVAESMKWHRV